MSNVGEHRGPRIGLHKYRCSAWVVRSRDVDLDPGNTFSGDPVPSLYSQLWRRQVAAPSEMSRQQFRKPEMIHNHYCRTPRLEKSNEFVTSDSGKYIGPLLKQLGFKRDRVNDQITSLDFLIDNIKRDMNSN